MFLFSMCKPRSIQSMVNVSVTLRFGYDNYNQMPFKRQEGTLGNNTKTIEKYCFNSSENGFFSFFNFYLFLWLWGHGNRSQGYMYVRRESLITQFIPSTRKVDFLFFHGIFFFFLLLCIFLFIVILTNRECELYNLCQFCTVIQPRPK